MELGITIVDKATTPDAPASKGGFQKIQLFKRRWVLTNIVVETIGVVFLVCDIRTLPNSPYLGDRSGLSSFLTVSNRYGEVVIILDQTILPRALSYP